MTGLTTTAAPAAAQSAVRLIVALSLVRLAAELHRSRRAGAREARG